MIKSIRKKVTVVINVETLADVITGSELYKRTIKEVWFQQVNDTVLRCYVDTDRVVDVHSEVDQADVLPVPVDRVLESGETFKAGFLDETGVGGDQDLVVFYEEVPA